MTPEDLLSGPRGRRTCFELRTAAEVNERAILDALVRSVDQAVYWHEPHSVDRMLADAEQRQALLPIAEALCATAATSWWARPLDLDAQFLVAFDGVPGPSLTGVRARLQDAMAAHRKRSLAVPSAVDWRRCSGYWWSAPVLFPSIETTRCIEGFGPARLWLVEDSMDWDSATAWSVGTLAAPRVFEIATPQHWIELVSRYPFEVTNVKRGDWWRTTGRDARWLMPDWLAVADDYDAVHVGVAVYLQCAGVALDVGGGAATVLAGWDPDATFWLDDVVQFIGAPTRWRRDHDDLTWRGTEQP